MAAEKNVHFGGFDTGNAEKNLLSHVWVFLFFVFFLFTSDLLRDLQAHHVCHWFSIMLFPGTVTLCCCVGPGHGASEGVRSYSLAVCCWERCRVGSCHPNHWRRQPARGRVRQLERFKTLSLALRNLARLVFPSTTPSPSSPPWPRTRTPTETLRQCFHPPCPTVNWHRPCDIIQAHL